ncbi:MULTISPECIES: type II secretory pathway, component PulD [unclassified Hydrogenobaculum]|uniref:type II secretion system protein GspD n=1 Tax=unclassified Hydrogenobaculum TaxID=2622382 RepID=UPI0001C502DC|nr:MULTISPECIES: type II secretory pathway, component PulD [unclassified Hydrogenobaculum]AEF19109.1 type II and III secretion system protein [Hydrogenobaculum sp. 3684]AEG46398.1 type II secretory pathway component PulD-like protein [Hydrogenobaculum sp. SHO]AGG15042.1 type II secretory pathway, component PulD [Hydrogenobaculum sp. HO]AGH93339.1 type II secretory pathway, component PulD [Hydrogenobaculum sp. SN]
MKKFLVFLIMVLYAYIAYPYHLIGNYQAPPKSQNNPSLPGFVVNPQDAFLLKPVTLNVKDTPIPQVLSYLSGITQVPIELKDNVQDRVSFYGQGTLKSILDTFCAYNNLYYKVKNGKIIVRRYISAVFQLNVPMTTTKAYNYNMTFGQSVTNSSSGGSVLGGTAINPIQNTGTNSSSSTFNFNENLAQNIVNLITPLLQDKRSKISYDPNTGLLTFFGSINDYKTVKSIVNKLNKELSEPIKIRINIIAINLLNEYSTGINISALFQHLKNLNLSLTAPITLTNSSNSLFKASLSGSNYSALLNALEQYGKTKSIDSETYTVLPNQPIVYAPTNTQSYISSYNIYIPPTVAGVVSTPAYIPIVSYLNTGTSITILPRLANNKKLMVDVYYSQNTAQNLNTQNITISQGVTVPIQFPEVSSQNSVLTSVLKPGQTIALISSVYDLKKNNEAGIPFLIRIPIIKYLFGNTDKYSNKVQFIITITYEGLGER